MALTGHLSDLSLSELIEFFCNQRKTGRLKVMYPNGAGFFFLQAGSVVDAQIGVLRGIDAVYYALTMPNARFEFSGSTDPIEKTINQPWTQVVLEGLRRLDEGIAPAEAFPPGYPQEPPTNSGGGQPRKSPVAVWSAPARPRMLGFLSLMSLSSGLRKPLVLAAIAVAVVASVAVVGVPAGWYRQGQVPVIQEMTVAGATVAEVPTQPMAELPVEEVTVEIPATIEAPVSTRRAPKPRAARDEGTVIRNKDLSEASSTLSRPEDSRSGPKRVVVTVTYDESGRVTQASGGDAAALRIARQKRFPAGRSGSATVTIPIN